MQGEIKKSGKFERFFKSKSVAGTFAGAAFIGGIFFADLSLTGNVVNKTPATSILSLIGLALIICSLILVFYVTRK